LALAPILVDRSVGFPCIAVRFLKQELALSWDMDTRFLDQLAEQLRVSKSPACSRAIGRLLTDMKRRCAEGEYHSTPEAEAAFRKLVDEEPACRKSAEDR
jgi:hypothetical protein